MQASMNTAEINMGLVIALTVALASRVVAETVLVQQDRRWCTKLWGRRRAVGIAPSVTATQTLPSAHAGNWVRSTRVLAQCLEIQDNRHSSPLGFQPQATIYF